MDLALLPQGYDAVVRKVMHALFGGISRSVVILLAVAVVIVAAPAIASCFDDRGLPGSPMVFLVLAVVAAANGFALFFTMTPRGARSHALRQLGRDLNLPYSRRLRVPRGLSALPSFRLRSGAWTVHDGTEGHRGPGPCWYSRRSWSTDGDEPTHWHSARRRPRC